MRIPVRAAFATVALLMAGAQPAAAQSLGVKGGVTFATQATSPSDALGEVTSKPGPIGGAYLTFRESQRMSFEVAGLVSQRRVGFEGGIIDTVTLIEVPLVVRYPFAKTSSLVIRAIGGGSFNYRISAREAVGGASSSATDAYKPIDFAVVFGAQAEWKQRWTFEGRYFLGLMDVYDVTIGGFTVRHRGIEALVGYKLR